MNLKLHQLVTLYYELNGFVSSQQNQPNLIGILKQKMSLKTKIYLQRLNNMVSEEFKIYEQAKKELFEKYGNEKDGVIEIPNNKYLQFNAEHFLILDVEKQIDIKQLWGDDFNIQALIDIETTDCYPVLFSILDVR